MKTYVVHVEIHYDTDDRDTRTEQEISRAVDDILEDADILAPRPGTGVYSYTITHTTRQYYHG